MPCTNPYAAELSRARTDAENKRVRDELTIVTRLLCGTLRHLEPMLLTRELVEMDEKVPGLLIWFEKHDKDDKVRIRAEAVAKLTPREREVLGL